MTCHAHAPTTTHITIHPRLAVPVNSREREPHQTEKNADFHAREKTFNPYQNMLTVPQSADAHLHSEYHPNFRVSEFWHTEVQHDVLSHV